VLIPQADTLARRLRDNLLVDPLVAGSSRRPSRERERETEEKKQPDASTARVLTELAHARPLNAAADNDQHREHDRNRRAAETRRQSARREHGQGECAFDAFSSRVASRRSTD
jgi:hypothetical protein